ncbi:MULTISPECIES: shikimate dehydrogenase [Alphaproteobacteria]|uniref:Shikimate dehydrogenase (NADP(+)) n=2 Tax=Alphaproteobacteria TaxID=28211 RepID=A0A512HMB4_9HYPH|nr:MULTISPECIES: shikimate dehydrogenase [Alphaproteobacteria]GEO86592.1 shikimate dehydrogenase (NADP(+)) [Ciceribacter naphthalenivorans]GLR20836.1 shikimate dehydrogenase (NADP(+)) [Ciceribacter naphthalenivorans]GLT03692.1 shikimate dehydrogenase (NADP(+)) [Sphingomonas psychrolutea]
MSDSRETINHHAFVVGYPIKHSRSPLIHGHWLKTMGIVGTYERVAVSPEDFADFIAGVKSGALGYCGGNVTIPHKEAAHALADETDALTDELGAANTLWVDDGKLKATNTDGIGFTSNLDDRHLGWDRGETAVVLGAGGASRAVIQALRERGFREIHVVNRTLERARELAHRFGPRVYPHAMEACAEVMQGADFFVNTTSLGMDGDPAPILPFHSLESDAVVTDIVYVPLKTAFLDQAERVGLATVDGLGMLLHQAVPGFEKWFGKRPVVDEVLRALVIADMEAHG